MVIMQYLSLIQPFCEEIFVIWMTHLTVFKPVGKNCLPQPSGLLYNVLSSSHAEKTEEHKDLCNALCLIKDMIAAVDLKVSEYEKNQKWLEILSKIENKTYTKLKNGHVFRKQALISKERTLLYEGLVFWKTATGRFKGTVTPTD